MDLADTFYLSSGLGTQMYSDALSCTGCELGAVFVNQLVKWDAQLQVDLDKMLDKAKAANEHRYFGVVRRED
ncbi:hypothetical protein MKW92_010907 [Papaver armeniacum]|nr:hypothetical protein MKW92_010907 [Papaver armeniacum]